MQEGLLLQHLLVGMGLDEIKCILGRGSHLKPAVQLRKGLSKLAVHRHELITTGLAEEIQESCTFHQFTEHTVFHFHPLNAPLP